MRMTFRRRWMIWQIQKLILPYRSPHISNEIDLVLMFFTHLSVPTFSTRRLILSQGKGKDSKKHQKLQLYSLYKWVLTDQEVTNWMKKYCSITSGNPFMSIFVIYFTLVSRRPVPLGAKVTKPSHWFPLYWFFLLQECIFLRNWKMSRKLWQFPPNLFFNILIRYRVVGHLRET